MAPGRRRRGLSGRQRRRSKCRAVSCAGLNAPQAVRLARTARARRRVGKPVTRTRPTRRAATARQRGEKKPEERNPRASGTALGSGPMWVVWLSGQGRPPDWGLRSWIWCIVFCVSWLLFWILRPAMRALGCCLRIQPAWQWIRSCRRVDAALGPGCGSVARRPRARFAGFLRRRGLAPGHERPPPASW